MFLQHFCINFVMEQLLAKHQTCCELLGLYDRFEILCVDNNYHL